MSNTMKWRVDELIMIRDPEGPTVWCVLEGDEIVAEFAQDKEAAQKVAGMHNVALMSCRLEFQHAMHDLANTISFAVTKTAEQLTKEK